MITMIGTTGAPTPTNGVAMNGAAMRYGGDDYADNANIHDCDVVLGRSLQYNNDNHSRGCELVGLVNLREIICTVIMPTVTVLGGTRDYLYFTSTTHFRWTTNKAQAQTSQSTYYPYVEGIDFYNGHLYFVSKTLK